jgi:regulator of protease activity HflC (stomatin/prohibitin superfamily)
VFDKLIDVLKQFGRAFVFWYICDPYEGGVILRLGKYHRMIENGWNWMWPGYIERALTANIAVHTLIVGPQSLYTKDGKQIVIKTVVTCTVEDSKTFLFKVNGGVQALDDAACGVVSELIQSKTLDELRDMDVSNDLTIKIRRFAKGWGMAITRVQIVDFTPMRSIRLLQSVNQSYVERGTEF